MSTAANLERARVAMTRYRILAILDVSRPYPVGETVLANVLSDVDLQATQSDIRRAMQYLADKKLIELNAPRDRHWEARLLPDGVDYVEGHRADDPGILRPPR